MTTINAPAIDQWVQSLQQRINGILETTLPAKSDSPTRLHKAMHYAVFNGGKRIRPLLVYATGLCFQADIALLDNAAAAIECIHCYSLVHDDLPGMDDDDYRRGQLSCHKAFDEATAILTGDALQSLAFTLLAQPQTHIAPTQQIKMLATLAHASGSLGMAGGQQLDLDHKNQLLSVPLRDHIHRLKTGALFQASVRLAALAHHADENILKQLDAFAHWIGLAFQAQDDYFDQDTLDQEEATSHITHLFAQAEKNLNALAINHTSLLHIMQYLQTRVL